MNNQNVFPDAPFLSSISFSHRTESTDRFFRFVSLLFFSPFSLSSHFPPFLLLFLDYSLLPASRLVVPLPPIRAYHIPTELRPCDMTWLINHALYIFFFSLLVVRQRNHEI
ncbi:hypothetical protein F4774DRAFT_388392 [Daldinia eschscholtzii]|nr:hypothetical protein F4774DRAFT_388392 [Daldinia eschscholtzii]